MSVTKIEEVQPAQSAGNTERIWQLGMALYAAHHAAVSIHGEKGVKLSARRLTLSEALLLAAQQLRDLKLPAEQEIASGDGYVPPGLPVLLHGWREYEILDAAGEAGFTLRRERRYFR